jgi:polygalacturonase
MKRQLPLCATLALTISLSLGNIPTSWSATLGCAAAPTSSFVVNVKHKGARGNAQTDDTAAIQAAIDQAAGKRGTALIPAGTYMVSAVGDNRLTLRSNMMLRLSQQAVLKAIPNGSDKYAVLHISGASNVSVVGGTLEGERAEHMGKTGEWGMGIRIDNGSEHITISGVVVKEMWGDGFYVEGANDVTFCSVTADNNRRQGLSIIETAGLIIKKSIFKNTHGTRPSAGIDIEPDTDEQHVSNVRIQDSQFLDNTGPGIAIVAKKALVSEIEITRNVFSGNHYPVFIRDVCGRQNARYEPEPSGGAYAYKDPTELVITKNDCQRVSPKAQGKKR